MIHGAGGGPPEAAHRRFKDPQAEHGRSGVHPGDADGFLVKPRQRLGQEEDSEDQISLAERNAKSEAVMPSRDGYEALAQKE